MNLLKNGWKIVLCLAVFQGLWADPPPISLTFYGLYGTPVQPLGLTTSITDAFGFNALGEWNASKYASWGLSFEQATFYYGGQGFNFPALNLEGRVFPLENGKDKFSPYIYGGAGLGLSSGSGPQLKAGLGSKVSLVGPLFFDLAVGSHWVQPPSSFQYVDLRAGLSYSIDFKGEEAKTPVPTPTALSTPMATPAASLTPQAMGTPLPTPAEMALEVGTPTPVISQAPVTTVAQSKQYYKIGMDAFLAGNYPLSLKALKKSVTLKEKHKHPYKYAETYATIGVIYQFHSTFPNHEQKALIYYKKALKIDPTTKSAKRYYKKLKAKLAKEAKAKKKKKPVATPTDSSAPPASTGTAPSSGPVSSDTSAISLF